MPRGCYWGSEGYIDNLLWMWRARVWGCVSRGGGGMEERNEGDTLGEWAGIYDSVICVRLPHWWPLNCGVYTLNWDHRAASLECYVALLFLTFVSYRVSKYLILESTAKNSVLEILEFRDLFEHRAPRTLESRSISPPLTCSVRYLLLAEVSRATVLESTENGQFRLIRVPFPLEYEFRSTTLLFLHPLSCFEQLFRNFFIRTLWLSVRERNG